MMTKTKPELGSPLERAFDTQLERLGQDLGTPARNFQFAPGRKWAFDRAWPLAKVAVELEGGQFGYTVQCHNCHQTVLARKKDGSLGKPVRLPGWHGAAGRFGGDIEKYNTASCRGWLLLRFGHDDVIGNPFEMIETIRNAMRCRVGTVEILEPLSEQQIAVLKYTSAGFVTHEIADRMSLSKFTVRRHIEGICQKLQARNRAAAVARALVWNVIDPTSIPWAIPMQYPYIDEE
jgi:DNA-binding CsgD family transcriptional regulator